MVRTLGTGRNRILGGYGPLLALGVSFLLVVTLVPTIDREQIESGAAQDTALNGQVVPAVSAPGAAVTGAPSGQGATTASTQAGPRTGSSIGINAGRSTDAAGRAGAPARAVGAGPCAGGRLKQVPGDPYSPPCIAWRAGKDNGGATSRGVTKDAITIGYRLPVENISDLQSTIGQLGGKGNQVPASTEADVKRTVEDLATYFGRHFQFYGRKLNLVQWKGKGSALNELFGAGQEAATADAIKAAQELKVFADVSAFTQPYNDALARQKVVAIGAPYMSQQWFAQHAPYSWSPFPDCTSLARNVAEYMNKRVFARPAEHAGGDLRGRPRKVALIAPDNPEYQRCAADGYAAVKAAGNTATNYTYTLDLNALSDQANNLAAKIKHDGITTVVLATDPLLPLLLTSRMSQQHYYPEWVVMGTVLTDTDMVGQLYDQSQWQHAFGLSMLGEQQPQTGSYAYAAAKSVDPDHEPTPGADLLYYLLYMVATGIQMAGPDLTPESFAAGMRAYPGGSGPAGTWGYPQGQYSPYRDSREIWWDPNSPSPYNGTNGRYVSTNQRYRPGRWPTGPAAPQQLALLQQEASTPPEQR
jgi:hypothetical protein